ncbi:MAG: hypothetical protein JWM54_2050 [Acidobacteriaceae bacterium]|nr:hypothetical protein [Acidobacteriaceae bacterium]
MAKPVAYRVFTPADAREELKRKIDDAPLDHAQAVLGAYDLLEQAHRSGVLEILRGVLAAQDTLITHIADLLTQPEIVNALRNLMVIGKLVGSINPEVLEASLGASVEQGRKGAPSVFSLLGRANTGDARRGLDVAMGLLSALGAAASKTPDRRPS